MNLLQTSVNDHWHGILSCTQHSALADMKTRRDEKINLESWEYVPVGHIWKFDLDFREQSIFFENFELTKSCFFLTIENLDKVFLDN